MSQGNRTRIYLVRHGTTEWNKGEIFRGQVDCRLNETGRAEARALALSFQDVPIDGICSSPLARAMETAQPIARIKGLSVTPHPAFIDLHFGEWQGLPLASVQEKYSTLYRIWREKPEEIAFPGGESLAAVTARAWEGLQRLVQENRGRTVMIVTHRVITKILICALLGLNNSHFWRIQQGTTAVNCFDYTGKAYNAVFINDTCHLKSLPAGAGKAD